MYIKEQLGVTVRRGDSRYDSWDKQYDRLKENLDTRYFVNYIDMMETVNQVRN